jgi:hypothetical protein
MRMKLLKAMLMVTVFVAFSTSLFAQQTGSVVGTVTDQTSAVIPHAKVVLTNTATKDIRTTSSNAEGFFSFSGVVSGDFSVRVEAKGFRSVEQTGIHISPDDRRNLNVSLTIATENASVVVQASASSITVDSGDLSNTLDAATIQKSTLTSRDVTELIKTLPGFNDFTDFGGVRNRTGYDATVTSIQSAVGNAVNSVGVPSRAGGADLTSDGAHIIDPGCNCNATQTVNPDMVAEVKVTSSAYGADQQTGPVVIAAVGKSGSSTYHGGAYMHYRNSALNSFDWMVNHVFVAGQAGSANPTAPTKPAERYYYPGGQIGGPVPHTHNKIVFFGGFEYYNQMFPEQNSGGLVRANVPTLSERAGHFDPTLADNAAACNAMASWVSGGYRCQNFTAIGTSTGAVGGIKNDDISAYIAPGAVALLNEIPKPNYAPTGNLDFNYVKELANTNNGYMFHTRVDFNINDSTKVYVSYNQQHELYGSPVMRWWFAGDAVDYPGGDASDAHSRTLSGNLVKVFNSTTTNEFLANLSYLYTPNSMSNEKVVDKTATKYPYNYPTTSPILPSVLNTWWNNDFGVPFQYDTGRYAYFIHKVQPTFSDNFTKVLRTHTIKAGASDYVVYDREASFGQSNGPNGTVGYGPVWGLPSTADGQSAYGLDPVLNFMTDLTSSYSVQAVTAPSLTGLTVGFYVEDDWKTTKRLTLNLGMRVTHDTPYTDATGVFGIPSWTLDRYRKDVAAGVTDLPGMRWHGLDLLGGGFHTDPSVPLAGHTLNALFYAPRFGLAYDVFGNTKTVARGGFGVYYYRDGIGGSAGTSEPMGGSSCQTTGSMSNSYLSQITGTSITCAGSTNGVTGGSANDPNDHVEPRSFTYNFTISQQTIAKTQLEVSYMGSQTTDLGNPISGNMNEQVPIGTYAKPDPNPASKYYGQILPLSATGGSDSNATVAKNLQDYVPYPNYSGLGIINHGAWANYNALLVSWNKREGALNYALNYTFSKTLGIIGNSIDPININNDYSVTSSDRTHVFNAVYSYEVGQRFKGSKLVGGALNGWMISGITGLQSGAPMQPSFSWNMGLGGTDGTTDLTIKKADGTVGTDFGTNALNTTTYLGAPNYTLFPKLTCNPGKGLTSGQYVNPSCFSLPTAPQFVTSGPTEGALAVVSGNGQSHMPYFRGPSFFKSDLAASRTIRITDRQNAQIKFSATNFLNHALTSFDESNSQNLSLNYTTGTLATKGTASGATWVYGVPNEKFGRRVLEMSLRYNF